jgi:Ca2+-binding RTX toxin-like protein
MIVVATNYHEGSMATIRGKNKNDRLDGTDADDDIFGYKGDDTINGGDGDDWIIGHEGKDKLSGESGADTFVFAFKSDLKSKNVDTLRDFNPAEDTILLDYTVFKHIGFGQINQDYFNVGKKAEDADDYLIFDPKKWTLAYDKDGAGGKDKVVFAKFKKTFGDGVEYGEALGLAFAGSFIERPDNGY